MANLFAIAFAENKQVYQAGETIFGVLLLNTDKELTLRGVRVELHGLGHVRIRSGKVKYVKNETYLALQAILLGRGPYQNGSDVKLQPGNYSFPFEFRLPPNGLPTSFEGPYGSIRYWIHGEADRPWRTNWQFDSPLFIVERVQIRDLALLEPSVKNEDRSLGLVCCPAGQLNARARIERSAYCPGEEVKITGHVSNQSSKQVTGTEVQFVQKVKFKAPHDTTRTVTEKLYVVTNERGLAPGEESDIQFDAFTIPSVQPTTEGFECVDISYEIRFIVRVARAFNTDIVFPVTITTTPPCVQSTLDPVLSQQIYRALANYLVSRVSAELANDETAQEGTEPGFSGVVSDGSGAQDSAGSQASPGVRVEGSERAGSASGKPYQYSRIV